MNEFEMPFGALDRQPTEQDVSLASFAPSTRPDLYMPQFTGEIESQHQTPSCGAHAGQALKQVLGNFIGSPEYLWKKMRLLDGLSPDQGSDLVTIFKVLNKQGICSINSMPNNSLVSNEEYASPNGLTPEMDIEASNHKITTYAFSWYPTFDEIKQAIYDHKAVMLRLQVGAEFWTKPDGTGSWQASDILPLRDSVPITSQHWVVAYAYDENYIYFINSWGSTWGQNGIGYFGADYSHRCIEMGTAVNLEQNKYIFNKVLRFGSKGFDVKQLQTKLGIKSDGIFGPQTLNAVQNFQSSHGLVADGIVGPLTNNELNK